MMYMEKVQDQYECFLQHIIAKFDAHHVKNQINNNNFNGKIDDSNIITSE